MEKITEAGFNDILVGTELYAATKMSQADMMDPHKAAQIREIADFLNSHPDPIFLIGTLVRGNKSPNMSNLEYIASYVKLNKARKEIDRQLKSY